MTSSRRVAAAFAVNTSPLPALLPVPGEGSRGDGYVLSSEIKKKKKLTKAPYLADISIYYMLLYSGAQVLQITTGGA
jgi:hypothetical protein